MTNKNILTIATGKQLYIELAVNLARSFFLWNKNPNITFHIVTDNTSLIPEDVSKFSKIISIEKGELGEGFSTKLHLDKLAPPGQTLFIDSDCLIFGDLSSIFERFHGKPVSVVGSFIAEGEWFGDVKSILKKYNLSKMPKFNGGIYYIESGEEATKVYRVARLLEKQYDDIGFVRLRNRPNDEVIMALSMAIHNHSPIMDDGTIMGDLQSCQGSYTIDVINGKCELTNPPYPNPLHQSWYTFERVTPLILHFLGTYTSDYPYKRETLFLKKLNNRRLSAFWRLYSIFYIELPSMLKTGIKNTFRPTYRALFGIRKIKQSDRII